MAINVSQAFHRTSANPVDESMALTKAQMLAVNDNLMPAYYFTICQDDGEIYLYDKSATASGTTGKFKKFEGGGGGGGTGEGVVITKTLLAAGWDANHQQSLTFDGYSADMGGVIGMPTNATAVQKEAYADSVINVVSQSGNVFTFEYETAPAIDLPVTLYAGGSGGSAEFPSGGTTGQALVKKSNADNDVEWGTINSIPNGGTTGQVLAKHSATDKDVEWVDQIDTQKEIKDNGTAVTDRDTLNFTDFDISDDSTNEETDIKAHRLTAGELAEICSTLPGAPTQQPIYSTTEHVVGTWIDGKPIYQKTIDFGYSLTNTDTQQEWLEPIGASVDRVIACWGNMHGRDNEWGAMLPWNFDGSTYAILGACTNNEPDTDKKNKVGIYWKGSCDWIIDPIITVQYTKTTD